MVGFKINTPRSVTFLYINNDHYRKETEKTAPFTIKSETEISLTKEVKTYKLKSTKDC